jgi:hypothetical protein
MVLTNAQRLAFFTEPAQMAIPAATVTQLEEEGIEMIDDLLEFDKDSIEQIAMNMRRPAAGLQPFAFSAKSQKRLIVACDMVRYYETVARPISVGGMRWLQVGKNFEIQWKALRAKKAEDDPETPKITKGFNPMKWSESMRDILHRCVGGRTIPLAYVVRDDATVPVAIPPLATDQPHSAEAGSIEAELITRASHAHPLFRDDSAAVYYKMEEATRGTTLAASIAPFQRTKDGRGAFRAIISQHAGEDKWQEEIRKQDAVLHNQKWKGQSNFALEQHCALHRNAFVQMEAATSHVDYQLPNPFTRVGYLLDSIENSDAGLQAAMAGVRTDKAPDGLRNNFESTVAHLLPYDPVMKKRTAGAKRHHGDISDVHVEQKSSIVSGLMKSGRGSESGVHLRYHTGDEYLKLSRPEKDELRIWRKTPEGKAAVARERNGNKSKKQRFKPNGGDTNAIAAAVDKKVSEKLKALQNEKNEAAAGEAFIMSCIKKFATGQVKLPDSASTAAISANEGANKDFLKSILKNVKN